MLIVMDMVTVIVLKATTAVTMSNVITTLNICNNDVHNKCKMFYKNYSAIGTLCIVIEFWMYLNCN